MKSKKYKVGEEYYTKEGQKCGLVYIIDEGFLINLAYFDELGVVFFSHKLDFIDKLFEEAPIAYIEENIAKKQSYLKELKEKIFLSETTLLKLNRSIEKEKEVIEHLKPRNYVLKGIEDFLDGKITHYAVNRGYSREILNLDSVTDEFRNGQRLLCLFGKSDGNLMWGLNQYKDGSGFFHDVTPCCSLEEAKEVIKKSITPDNIRCSDIRLAKEYGIEINQKKLDAYNTRTRAGINKDISELESDLIKKRKMLLDLDTL